MIIKDIKSLFNKFYDDLFEEYDSQKQNFSKDNSFKYDYIPIERYNLFFGNDDEQSIHTKEEIFDKITLSLIINKPPKSYDNKKCYNKFTYIKRNYNISVKCDRELDDNDIYKLNENPDCRKYLQLGFLIIDEYYEEYLQSPLFFNSIN